MEMVNFSKKKYFVLTGKLESIYYWQRRPLHNQKLVSIFNLTFLFSKLVLVFPVVTITFKESLSGRFYTLNHIMLLNMSAWFQ